MSSTLTLSKNLLAVSLSAEEKGGISGWLSESGNWSVFRLHFNSHLLHLVLGKKTLLFPTNPSLFLQTGRIQRAPVASGSDLEW